MISQSILTHLIMRLTARIRWILRGGDRCQNRESSLQKVDRCDKTEMEWMRASASMPIVSKPVCVDGYELLDGGVADSIPVQKMQELGFDKTVVVLTQPRDYVKKRIS